MSRKWGQVSNKPVLTSSRIRCLLFGKRVVKVTSPDKHKFVLAANQSHFQRYLRIHNISRELATYLYDQHQLAGRRDVEIVYVEGYQQNSNYTEDVHEFINHYAKRGLVTIVFDVD